MIALVGSLAGFSVHLLVVGRGQPGSQRAVQVVQREMRLARTSASNCD